MCNLVGIDALSAATAAGGIRHARMSEVLVGEIRFVMVYSECTVMATIYIEPRYCIT